MKKLLTFAVLFISSTSVSFAVQLFNPLGKDATFRTLAEKIFSGLSNILMVVVPIVIVVGAFQMMFATGDPEKFKKGQKTIVYAVIGLVVLLLAQGIVAIMESIFTTGV